MTVVYDSIQYNILQAFVTQSFIIEKCLFFCAYNIKTHNHDGLVGSSGLWFCSHVVRDSNPVTIPT